MEKIEKIKRIGVFKRPKNFDAIPVFNPHGDQTTLFQGKVARAKEVVKTTLWMPEEELKKYRSA